MLYECILFNSHCNSNYTECEQHLSSWSKLPTCHPTYENAVVDGVITVCPGSSDPPEKIFDIFASENEIYTIYWLFRYFRLNIIRLESKIISGHMNSIGYNSSIQYFRSDIQYVEWQSMQNLPVLMASVSVIVEYFFKKKVSESA